MSSAHTRPSLKISPGSGCDRAGPPLSPVPVARFPPTGLFPRGCVWMTFRRVPGNSGSRRGGSEVCRPPEAAQFRARIWMRARCHPVGMPLRRDSYPPLTRRLPPWWRGPHPVSPFIPSPQAGGSPPRPLFDDRLSVCPHHPKNFFLADNLLKPKWFFINEYFIIIFCA